VVGAAVGTVVTGAAVVVVVDGVPVPMTVVAGATVGVVGTLKHRS